jgi:hypothetical protein
VTGNNVTYTFPSGGAGRFVRLKVTGPSYLEIGLTAAVFEPKPGLACHRALAGSALRLGLRLATTFIACSGQVHEQHGETQPDEAVVILVGEAANGGEHYTGKLDEHRRVLRDEAWIEFLECTAQAGTCSAMLSLLSPSRPDIR